MTGPAALVDRWAATQPHAPAVVATDGAVVSYRDLRERTGRLAHCLRAWGVGPEAAVGVLLPRSVALAEASLAVLWSGAMAVPLDPEQPDERLARLVADTAAVVVLTTTEQAGRLDIDSRVICLDDPDVATAVAAAPPAPPMPVHPDQGAYVIFTSGSTGTPKGAVLTHGALAHLVEWHGGFYGVGPGARGGWAASLGFDAATWELWSALGLGACLCVAPEEARRDVAALARWLADREVTDAFLTTSVGEAAIASGAFERTSLRSLTLGGELLRRRPPPGTRFRVVNIYGPTETTVLATAGVVEPGEGVPSIGWPIEGAVVRVLGEDGLPVAPGGEGEVLIGGAGLGRGYTGRPSLTAERWVPDPFGTPGSRLYRTGDLARLNEDGSLSFLGRLDDQVKLRGYRVEPGEVEATLAAHPDVREAVVAVHEPAPGDRRLVAYVVPGDPDDRDDEAVVAGWQLLFDNAYAASDAERPDFDVSGWNDTATRSPIPATEMAEWVEATVARLRALSPRRVLEVGCGTGLLLLRLAPDAERYVGTDLSPVALERLRRAVAETPAAGVVKLARQEALDIGTWGEEAFDTVVLNSVVQYFPDVDHLVGALERAVAATADGGAVFVGDVRSLPLLDAFWGWVARVQARPGASDDDVRRAAAEARALDKELVLDPALFAGLARRLPRVTGVEVRPRRGRARNELVKYRYDVVLRVGAPIDAVAPAWRDWSPGFDVERLLREGVGVLGLRRVPNARVADDVAFARSAPDAPAGVDPEDLIEMGERLGHRVEVSWSSAWPDGAFDVAFVPDRLPPAAVAFPQAEPAEDLARHATEPARLRLSRLVVPRLRSWVAARLPAFMVPSAFVVVDGLPRLPSGKVDRRRLPPPGDKRPELSVPYAPPRGPVEEVVAAVFAELLGLDRVGAHDDFFELGGHSLLATQVVARVSGAFGVEVPLRALFESSTPAGLATAVAAAAGAPARPPLAEGDGERPASFGQERLWLVERLHPGRSAYNVAVGLRLAGPLDPEALAGAWDDVVARHEPLRTALAPGDDGVLRQRVLPAGAPLEVRHGPLDEAEAAHPFDIEAGPPARAVLFREGPSDHALLVVAHHSAVDGWSLGVLFRELAARYDARLAGGGPVPPPPVPGHGDWAAWQRSWLRGEVLEAEVAWWRERLAGAPEVLELPTDRPRPAVPRHRGALHRFELDAALVARLEALARERRATVVMVLLAAFDVLLARHAGVDDVVVGTMVADRIHPELEGLVGFFANTVALRTDCSGDPTFAELLARVRAGALDVYAHQDVPFQHVVEALAPRRDLAHHPVFQVSFTMVSPALEGVGFPGLHAEPLPVDPRGARFDLDLTIGELPDAGLSARLEYDVDLFDQATVAALADRYRCLLEAALAAPDTPLSRLPLERERADLAGPYPADPPDTPLHRWFEAVAAERGRQPAVVDHAGTVLTYAELDARANRVAHRLRHCGVRRDAVVALCLPRSVDALVGILAVLKAGGVWLSIDPDDPPARRSLLAEDSGAVLVLTELPEGSDEDGPPDGDVHPENLAYLFYTSGSTGRPKAVAVSHRAVVGFMRAFAERLGLDDGTVGLAALKPTFDVSVVNLLLPLLVGGTVVLPPPGAEIDGRELRRLLDEHRCTTVHLTPSVWQLVLDAGWEGSDRLAAVCGGEPALPSLWSALAARAGSAWNAYGPTEATIWATVAEVDDPDAVDLGEPLGNGTVHVLDDRLEPAPDGVVGELCIGGVGLARGYLGRPGLTAERFVPDPFGPPGSRLYRTGDRVRRRHDGSLRFLGRVDQQVKVRGQRVELGEIETVLEAHPRVGRAVVATPDRRRLVAYTVGTATATELRAWVAARLPAAMAPSAFVAVEAFPLTASGKVDRARLPDPGRERPELSAPYTPPRDAVEEVVAAVFAELLGLDRVGAHDDFFELGGHSLLAAQVVARVSEAVGADVPLRALFESPSPAGLAAASGVADSRVRPPLAPAGGDEERPASFGQERLWLVERLHPGRSAYNVAVGLRLAGPLDPEALAGAWDDVVARHEPLRTALAPGDDGVLRQRVLPAGAPLEVRHGPLDEAEAAHPFDIEAGPPARAVLFREGPSDHALLVVAHHSAVDGWSLGVLFRELAARYDARAAGGPPPPPPPAPAPAHGDWAAWQRSWLRGDVLEAEVSWWRSRLAGAPEVLELPTDRPRPAVPRHRGALHRFELDAALVARLEALARERRATLFMVLLAAFDVLVARHAGVDDVVVGTMVADRTHPDLEGLVGFFANTVALRTDCSGDPTFAELVARVRADALDAYAHQDVPFQHVVETVAPRRDLAHHPLFQVALLLQRQGLDGVAMSGLAVDRLDVAGRGSPLDLMLSLEDAAGGGLRAELEYDTDLFDEATVAALAERFRGLVQAVVEDPHRPVSRLPLLTEAERAAVAAGNATDAPYPDATLHRLFAERVATRPDGLAVIDAGGVTMTYGELDAASDRLAHHLRRRGVGADSVVALCLPRSIDYVVAVVAVAKAGGAWVAVDPSYPDERRRFMIEDSGAVVVLDALPPEESGAALPAGPPDDVACPDNLAYLVYTSGSTGAPKGVSATHRSCVARQAWYAAELPWQPDEVACIKTSPSFVDAVGELWAPLLAGVPVLVVPEDVPPDGARLVDVLADHHVTRIILVPSLLAALLEQPPERLARLARLTLWVASGEPLPASTAAAFAARLPGATLVNLYGMSEVGPDATACVAPGDRDEPPPIGRPLHNVQVHVLDGRRAPVPPGVTGELYIGGVGLARGYHRRPGLTAERFVPDPFGPPGSRLYRTGDLVRRRPDGLLAFVGRADHQIKLRGHRVEPAEIEAVLERHPGVEAAVVAPRGERLVAYVAGAVDVPDLRAHASARLPAFLAPSAFVRVEEWPRLPNGKVDRAALPDPQPPSEQRPAGGGSPLEELVAATFADVLGLERVGVGDDFFELGGHSLLASRLVTRLAASLGRDVPLRALFEAPSPGGLAAALAHEGTAEDALPLVPVGRHADPPASFGQQRLWFLDRLDPGRSAYNVPVAVRLDGPLDVEALAAAWDDVVGRHEPLRTALHEADDGTLVQRVGASGAHLAVDPPGDAAEDARLPFDLAAGPLVRAAVRRTEDGAHVLSVVAHHAVVDGWSLRLVFEELALRYRARLAGDDRPPAPPAVHHADWAAWQRRRSFDAHTAWWREHLAGAPEVLQLPSDRPRPAVQGGCGAVVRTTVGPDVVAGIERLARTEQATLFVVLLAALDCVLARQSGCEDVVVGTVVANRGHPALDELVGFFANTVAVRVDCAGDPSFRDLVARARVAALGAFAHQDVPFERVVDAVAARRDLAHHPVFQVALVLQNTGEADVDLPGLAVTWLRVHPGTSRFDVSVVAWPAGGGLELELEYDTELFDERSVAALGERLARVLAAVTADPAVRLSELPLLDRAEHRRLAASWESVAEPVPPPFPRLFEAVAAARPQAPAVVDADDSVLTYADLDARANGVAHWLRARGVGAEAVVALALPRSPELVTAALAVLKAGGAWAPVDPEYPEERRRFMLDDARAVVVLDHLPDAPARPDPPDAVLHPDQLAYVIYTSGSTGTPKGAGVTHRSLSSLVLVQRPMGVGPSDRVVQFAPSSFDAWVWEVVMALGTGASLVLASRDELLPGPPLQATLRDRGITVATLPPTALAELDGDDLPGMRVVMSAGEACRPDIVRRMSRAGRTVFNGYGPTEATVCAAMGVLDPEAPTTPLGAPVANTRLYVLDRHGTLAPPGAIGELHVAGMGVGRGYLRRPGLTAERFVPDPFGPPGARLYRTGDRVRLGHDGSLEFRGRLDEQVKIRGHRVEPAEAAAALETHPAVRRAVAGAVDGRLVAWVVPDGAPPTTGELRAHLSSRLPLFLVPSAFVVVDDLPLGPSGKVDRRRLPAPGTAALASTGEHVAPRTALERALAEIWADVLRLERVGATDNFFDIGGDSILSIRIVAKATQAGIALTPRQVFQHQTVAELAAAAGVARAGGADAGSTHGAVPLTPIQRWFFEADFPDRHHFTQSVLTRVPPGLDRATLAAAAHRVVEHHEALRLRFREQPDGWVQETAEQEAAELLVVHDVAGSRPEAVTALAAEAHAALDLAAGPLLRLVLFDHGPDRPGRLLVVVHHLAVDVVSWPVLLEDLEAAYLAPGRRLPARTTPFARWAARLDEWAHSAEVAATAGHWASVADGLPAFPGSHLPPGRMGEAEAVRTVLGPEVTEALLRGVPARHRANMTETVCAALLLAVRAWTGLDDLLVDVEGHGREDLFDDVDVTRTVGWFTSMYPVRLHTAEVDPAAVLDAAKRTLRAVPHKGLSHGALRYLHRDPEMRARLAALPPAPVGVNYLGRFEARDEALFALTDELRGPPASPKAPRAHLLEMNAVVFEGSLRTTWTYAPAVHAPDDVACLAQAFDEALAALAAARPADIDAADFPLARLGDRGLDALRRYAADDG